MFLMKNKRNKKNKNKRKKRRRGRRRNVTPWEPPTGCGGTTAAARPFGFVWCVL
jgi:hypothetical protein